MCASPLEAPLDVLVIGAGPAGAASAALLHRAGKTVRVVEKQHFPRFVIGESLLPHCMDVLDAAGLLPAVEARGYLVKRGALFYRGSDRCSFDFGDAFTKGWGWTWQVPRADFDKTLADATEAMGVPFHYGHEVVSAKLDGAPEVVVRDEAGQTHVLHPKHVVDASGYGRVLPRLLDLDEPSHLPTRHALFTHLEGDRRPPGPDEGRIWICIHPGHDGGLGAGKAWLWIIPFSTGKTSVGAVSTPDFFDAFPGSPEEKLRAILRAEPAARDRLSDGAFEFEPRVLSGYSISVKRLHGPGYCLVGNATEFLDPVFSSGVTLALESAHRATGLVLRELDGQEPDWQVEYTEHMMRGIDVFRTFVTRWYDGSLPAIFFADGKTEDISKQICSVLAGYVWDSENPFVRDHARRVDLLAKVARSGRRDGFVAHPHT
jgi:flavin-dependent dehydrogenase